jgi:hypothetical protein
MMKITYDETEEFAHDLKKLLKRFRSLREDQEVLKRNAIELFHVHGLDNRSIFRISGLGTGDVLPYKVKKFACKALKGEGNRSGVRVIYAYLVKVQKVVFLEIYYKSDQENENRQRVTDFLKKLANP